MPVPLFGCRSCGVHDAIVFCLCCAARLCLHCDAAVHGAGAALHPRAQLCDACCDAPAALRCDGTVTLCAACVARGAPGVTRTGVATYTGCPGPAEMARLISVDPPEPHQDLDAWIAHRLPWLLDQQPPPPPLDHWDVAMETARLEKMLADSGYPPPEQEQPPAAHAPPPPPPPPPPEYSSYGTGTGIGIGIGTNQNQQLLSSSPAGRCQQAVSSAVHTCWQNNNAFPSTSGVLPESADFMPPQTTTTTCADHDQMLLDESAVAKKKREHRERAKQRYKDKKKNRRFGRQILYASRKARADERTRVRGRFAKAQRNDHPQTDDGPSTSTSASTATTVKWETIS